MRKKKIAIIATVMCLILGSSMTAFAETKTFSFKIEPTAYDDGDWLAKKADNEQIAYITPTSIVGTGRVWAAVYDQRGGTQHTIDVSIRPGTENVRRASSYYVTGVAGTTYRLLGGDNEWEVTSDSFTVTGRWTP